MSFIILHTPDVQTFRVTLTEKAIQPGPNFVFKFKNEVTRKEFTVTLTDVSVCVARYNEFQIAGTAFPSGGWYSYEARQAKLSGGYTIVEIGRMYVMNNDPISFTEPSSTPIFNENE